MFQVAKELASASNRWVAGLEQTRWDAINVVQTTKGKFLLITRYCTLWQGELGHYKIQIFDTIDELAKALDASNPLDRDILVQLGKSSEIAEQI